MPAPPADHSGYLRGGATAILLADPEFNAALGGRIYNRRAPANTPWPFCRVETPDNFTTEAAGWVGGEVALFVHIFDRDDGAEERIDRLSRRASWLLDDSKPVLTLDPGETGATPQVMELWRQGSNLLSDESSADAYHAAIEFSATTAVER